MGVEETRLPAGRSVWAAEGPEAVWERHQEIVSEMEVLLGQPAVLVAVD